MVLLHCKTINVLTFKLLKHFTKTILFLNIIQQVIIKDLLEARHGGRSWAAVWGMGTTGEAEPLLPGDWRSAGTSPKASAPGHADFVPDTGEVLLLSQFSSPALRGIRHGDAGSLLCAMLVSVCPSKHGALSCFFKCT